MRIITTIIVLILSTLLFADCSPFYQSGSHSAVIRGTVNYRERIALPPDAVVSIKLVDVSRADAPAVTIGEQTIENPGQVPIPFEIQYDSALIDTRYTYAIQATITYDGELRFINTTRYSVIMHGNPSPIEVILEKVG
jgi:uncharacterized lipoprotein YbaY